MAQDQNGRRYDARPKDPAVPPHMASAPGLNKLQKASFAGKNLAASRKIGGDDAAPAKRARRKGGRGSSGDPAAKKSPAKAAKRSRGKSGGRKDATPTLETKVE
jgi:hypothetical protein